MCGAELEAGAGLIAGLARGGLVMAGDWSAQCYGQGMLWYWGWATMSRTGKMTG